MLERAVDSLEADVGRRASPSSLSMMLSTTPEPASSPLNVFAKRVWLIVPPSQSAGVDSCLSIVKAPLARLVKSMRRNLRRIVTGVLNKRDPRGGRL